MGAMMERARKRLSKRAKKGCRGWPVASVALYGDDIRVTEEVLAFITEAGARSVVMTDRIIGCPPRLTDRAAARRDAALQEVGAELDALSPRSLRGADA